MPKSSFPARRLMCVVRRTCVTAIAAVSLGLSGSLSRASVTAVGAVAPAPPVGGGAYAGAAVIGDSGYGSIAITGGTGLSGTGGVTVGNGVAGIGVLTLSGFESDYILSSVGTDVAIGDEGVGSVSLSSQARIVVPDDTNLAVQTTGAGRLTVNGLGTVYANGDDLTIGLRGQGIMDVQAGGVVTADAVILGDLDTADGSLTVTGELSRFTSGALMLGDAGDARVDVTSGGRLTSASLTMSTLATSTSSLIVSGAGSVCTISGIATVGDAGIASVSVTNGGRIDFGSSLILGADAVSQAAITIDGAGSAITTVGGLTTSLGTANITLSNGGQLRVGSVSTLGTNANLVLDGGRFVITSLTLVGRISGSGVIEAGSVGISATGAGGSIRTHAGDHLELTGNLVNSGKVDLDGGEFEIRGNASNNSDIDLRNGAVLRVGSTGLDNNSGAQIAITGGTADVFGAVDNNLGAEIVVVGGATAVFHDAFTSAGTVFVSASSEIAVLENLSFTPTSLLQLNVQDAASADAVHVGTSATLNGTLDLSLTGGYVPQYLVPHALVHATTVSGVFASVTGNQISASKWLALTYDVDAVYMTAALPGDANLDGTVNFNDLLALARNYNQSPGQTWQEGDFDANGSVNFNDLLALARHYNQAVLAGELPGGSLLATDWALAQSLVPEPALMLAAPLLFGPRRRRRS